MLQVKRAILAAVILAAGVGQAHGFNFGQTTVVPPTSPQVLCQSAAPVSLGGTLTETALLTCAIPALKANDALRVTYTATYTGSTNNKTIRPKLGGTQLYASVRSTGTAVADTVPLAIYNRGATNSQIYSTTYATLQTSAPLTASIETASGTTFTITGQTTLETGFAATSTSGSGTTVTVTKAAHGLNTGEYVQVSGATPSGYNSDPVVITVVDANTFTYASSATGAVSVQPTIKRYSVVKMESYSVELLPGGN